MALTSDVHTSGMFNRGSERDLLDRLVVAARAGDSQVLVLRGEAGIGKTALLEYVALRSSGCRIIRASGAESEMELAFAGLHQLCASMLDRLDRLPDPQREALSTAFGLSSGKPPDRFIVGLAVLSLLSDVAEEQPLVCLVDDAQWFDQVSAQTLAFVARRLLAEPIAMVFGVRDMTGNDGLSALPQLMVRGLHEDDARALLDSVLPGRMDDQVRDRIVAESHGNPLALLELPRGLSAAELAGGFGRPDAQPLAGKIERSFAQRVRALPADTRQFLLTAAAESVGDATLLLRATQQLGVAADAAAPAVAAGLIEAGARVRFRHPLVRSATYRAATPAQRREVHQALSDATDAAVDPDRRAWHRAHAVDDADEQVAADLMFSADRAQRRGGVAAAAEFLHRATELTPDPQTRAIRALASAQAQMQSGAFEAALKMLVTAGEGVTDELHLARVSLLRAQIAFALGPDAEAPRLLLEAARRLEPLDTELARDTYRDALGAAIVTGGLAEGSGVLEVVRAVQAAPRPAQPRAGDLLLDTLAVAFTDGYAAAVSLARETLRAFRAQGAFDASDQPWLWLATIVAVKLLGRRELVSTHRQPRPYRPGHRRSQPAADKPKRTRRGQPCRGRAQRLPRWSRRSRQSPRLRAPGWRHTARSRWQRGTATRPMLSAHRGEHGGRGVPRRRQRNLGYAVGASAADERPRQVRRCPRCGACGGGTSIESGATFWSLPELIESAIRVGRTDLAENAYDCRLARNVRTPPEPTGRSVCWLDRVRCWRAAVRRTSTWRRSTAWVERASGWNWLAPDCCTASELPTGWRTAKHARAVLTDTHETFHRCGRWRVCGARSQLSFTTGAVVPEGTAATHAALTAQEAHIARLASDGLTNPEIGAQLFLESAHH